MQIVAYERIYTHTYTAGNDERRAHDEYSGSGNQHHILVSALLTSILLSILGRFIYCWAKKIHWTDHNKCPEAITTCKQFDEKLKEIAQYLTYKLGEWLIEMPKKWEK